MKFVGVEVVEKHRTDRAVLIESEWDDVWLPLSQIEIKPSGDGLTQICTMPEWLAVEKGLI